MTALLTRFRSDHLHIRRVRLPLTHERPESRSTVPRPGARETSLAAGRERLASSAELDTMRALHPSRITSR